MKAELILLYNLYYPKTAFYTLRIEGGLYTEYANFCYRMKKDKKTKRQLGELNRLLYNIGNKYGAQDEFFKREGRAERLPPPTHRFFDSDGEDDFGIRLYCIKLSEEAVLLLNGDLKLAQRIKDCKNCKPHFDFANAVSDALYYAQQNDEIEIDGRDILVEEDFYLNIKL